MPRILVIDDDKQVLTSLRELFRYEGYEVLEAADGKEGLRLCAEQAVDVVITDILMPEKDGLETIAALRRNHPGVPIIAMSGGGNLVGSTDCLIMGGMMGAQAILTKPFSADEVLTTISGVLGTDEVHKDCQGRLPGGL
ncbi:MAG: response regulator [Deltaproteobacteria bacterium]|nr:response regulator [Deltaproteobacteria bacterium]